VALIGRVCEFVQQTFVALQEPGLAASTVLEHSEVEALLSAALALGLTVAKQRTAEGQSAAVDLIDFLARTLTAVQQTVELRPELLMDPLQPTTVATAAFAASEQCEFRTAAYYVFNFGGKDGADMDQVVAEYRSSDCKLAPAGYNIPTGQHWLVGTVNTMVELSGRARTSISL
jgi:hypothetical protein